MQIGMVGLGRMGASLVRRLLADGHECVVFDTDADTVAKLSEEGAIGADSVADLAARLSAPRAIWVMVPAELTGTVLDDLAAHLDSDDVLIDGGNSYYREDIDRAEALRESGIHHVDVGTSGGVFGLVGCRGRLRVLRRDSGGAPRRCGQWPPHHRHHQRPPLHAARQPSRAVGRGLDCRAQRSRRSSRRPGDADLRDGQARVRFLTVPRKRHPMATRLGATPYSLSPRQPTVDSFDRRYRFGGRTTGRSDGAYAAALLRAFFSARIGHFLHSGFDLQHFFFTLPALISLRTTSCGEGGAFPGLGSSLQHEYPQRPAGFGVFEFD
ncbi:NAD(P)-binding domain-containing protein [Sporichthya sp.]|uniref:NAD(P)-binding domain-containing protein n=1 Tax=Sporichthya sp. TaxID=65475 RepID=UPI0025E19B9F|nr:NAD(P)-binding domain-containing protein [Sporichthya sp.]